MEDYENTRGAVYVAFGRPYLAMALLSFKTLRETNPDVPVCIITNIPLDGETIEFFRPGRDSIVFLNKETSSNRDVKTSFVRYAPFEKGLFIDCDTVVLGDLSSAWSLLDYFDLAFRLNSYSQTAPGKGDITILDGLKVSDLPHWNSGVILYNKNSRVEEFFDLWRKSYEKVGVQYDQVSLVEAIFLSSARVLSLDYKWNSVDPLIGRKKWRREAIVFHYATNISDKIVDAVMKCDKYLEGFPGETAKKFLLERRKNKRRLGILKYIAAIVVWRFYSPVSFLNNGKI